ncbi:NAD(P)H-flavin reductase [Endozoicomonas sp. SCSIO W0465]|uniref:NAD(P)H-flavin reductase n=1 Tax=Endozoicomonas sp. SCSIO W0465 TaxID=2918516 RepID=UPI0020762E14|nr:NAD(P)H-flavin reductase [Endozoicomonas sp. SCSIO W0465]USE36616.1 NAD(P)H-flavin reductase [Endozoicomonas sp. SCSIO W0465]
MQINQVSIQSCQVSDLQLLSEGIYRVILKPHQGYIPDYRAGQYLEILLAGGEACAFSIASPPVPMQKELELHIQKLPSSANSIQLFNELEQGSVSIRMPKGRCCLAGIPDKPLVFIAAGTGFAQMKSMIEFSLEQPGHKDIYLYWGARSPEGFYMPNLPIHWASSYFHYHPVVSDALGEDGWKGRQGLLFEAVIDDKNLFPGSEIFISGSPQMVYATFDALVAVNFTPENIHSDVFEYAPRS